jgi:hypothetical protein
MKVVSSVATLGRGYCPSRFQISADLQTQILVSWPCVVIDDGIDFASCTALTEVCIQGFKVDAAWSSYAYCVPKLEGFWFQIHYQVNIYGVHR